MSGFSAPADSNGLNGLLAQLRAQQTKQPKLQSSYNYYPGAYYGQPQQVPHSYQQASVSSPLPTPPTNGQQPHHSSAIMSPVQTPHTNQPLAPATVGAPASNTDRTSSLLNLLKFQQAPPSSTTTATSSSTRLPSALGQPLPPSREPSLSFGTANPVGQVSASGHGRGGSDLLAALMGTSASRSTSVSSPQPAIASKSSPSGLGAATPTSPPPDSQAYLLSLLNKPAQDKEDATPHLQPAQSERPTCHNSKRQDEVDTLRQSFESTSIGATSNPEHNKSEELKENIPVVAPKANPGKFNYVNPFEQLAASSPRPPSKPTTPTVQASTSTPPIQILKREAPDNKRKMDERSNYSSPAHSKRRLEASSQASSGPPTPLPDGRTQLEALIGIGAQEQKEHDAKEAVSDALQDVGDKVDKEVQEAIARAEQKEQLAPVQNDLRNMFAAKTEQEFEETAVEAAVAIKNELEKEENKDALADLPSPVADFVKDIIDDAAQGHLAEGHVADSWESADAEDSPEKDEDEESMVKVFNFPMKPWSTIDIMESYDPCPYLRDDVVLDIARLKKEFDQVDRQLVTASQDFIVYGMSKNGGIRIIRQDDGTDVKIFTETQDRIYNVATSTSSTDMIDVIIGTGVSGTVYWATIRNGEADHLAEGNPEMHGFALPPIPTHESEAMGGVLKTRARKSANHPEFFAVGRGRNIYVIWPSVILKHACFKSGNNRVADIEKYLAKQSLKVNTGKAGKDFTFSDDESTIVSLDKAGRIKFWDIRAFTQSQDNSHYAPKQTRPMEINTPLMTLNTTAPNEKAWPASVIFVDKQRPYQRGGPLRYLVVGLKQNHTLQLWDLALRKPVQEVNLPHSKESDAVCSVLYNAATGMVIVGHPTRNSIYFIHLSAPKYAMPKSVSQAEYIIKLSNSAPTDTEVGATAVFSGVREYSFANKGALRSLDILQDPTAEAESTTIFELYAMHSKGVTCLSIKHADLGWDSQSRVIQPIDAENAEVILIRELKEFSPENGDNPQPAAPGRKNSRATAIMGDVPKEILKKPNSEHATATKVDHKADTQSVSTERVATPSGTERSEKSDKKKRRKANSLTDTTLSASTSTAASSTKHVATQARKNTYETLLPKAETKKLAPTEPIENAIQKLAISNSDLTDLSIKLSRDVGQLLGNSFASLTNTIREDRQTQAAVAEAKQDAMLRLVSKTLSENIEATLGQIINLTINTTVVPSIADVTSKVVSEAVNNQVATKLNAQVAQVVPKELHKILPDAISKALREPQLLKLMSETLSRGVIFKVEEQFANTLHNTVVPAFKQLAITTSQHVAHDVERKAAETIGTLERQRHADSIKIQNLTELVTRLSQTVSSMADAQTEFQAQFMKMQQQEKASADQSAPPSSARSAPVEQSREDKEYDEMLQFIQTAMNEGKFDLAVISWLQTKREQEFFRRYFIQYKPTFVQNLSPLLLLSLGASITSDFSDMLNDRLNWIETIVESVSSRIDGGDVPGYVQLLQSMTSQPELLLPPSEDVLDLIPKVLRIYIQRLEHLFMRISNANERDPARKRVSLLSARATKIVDITTHLAGQLSQMS